MLTRVTIRNFKRFAEVAVELGNPVVFIGPNNSGKTTALQALALWDVGLRRWNEKRQGQAPEKRPGVRQAAARHLGPLFGSAWEDRMLASIQQVESAMMTLGKGSPWSPDTKVSDDFLDPLFDNFFRGLDLPNLMRKTDYHTLAPFVPRELIDPEVVEVLDRIVAVCERAIPL